MVDHHWWLCGDMKSTHMIASDVSLNVLEPPIINVWPPIEIAEAECLDTINGANRDHKLFRYSATTGDVIISNQKFQKFESSKV